MENWLLNWTSFILRNIHAEIDGKTWNDGVEWIVPMFEAWKKNTDYGKLYQMKTSTLTKSQMDDFLQSIGGLKNGYYLNEKPIVDSDFFEIESGWYPLVKELIEDLIALGWDKRICQIKEKFGGLRFYINEGSDEVFKRIRQAEYDSYKICEITGQPGELRTDIGWYRTLCEEEYLKIKNKQDANRKNN